MLSSQSKYFIQLSGRNFQKHTAKIILSDSENSDHLPSRKPDKIIKQLTTPFAYMYLTNDKLRTVSAFF